MLELNKKRDPKALYIYCANIYIEVFSKLYLRLLQQEKIDKELEIDINSKNLDNEAICYKEICAINIRIFKYLYKQELDSDFWNDTISSFILNYMSSNTIDNEEDLEKKVRSITRELQYKTLSFDLLDGAYAIEAFIRFYRQKFMR